MIFQINRFLHCQFFKNWFHYIVLSIWGLLKLGYFIVQEIGTFVQVQIIENLSRNYLIYYLFDLCVKRKKKQREYYCCHWFIFSTKQTITLGSLKGGVFQWLWRDLAWIYQWLKQLWSKIAFKRRADETISSFL